MICTRCGKLCETLWQRDDYQLCEPCVIVYLNAQGIISRVADTAPPVCLSAVKGFPDDALADTGLLLRRLWDRSEGNVLDDLVGLPVNNPRDRLARHPIAACYVTDLIASSALLPDGNDLLAGESLTCITHVDQPCQRASQLCGIAETPMGHLASTAGHLTPIYIPSTYPPHNAVAPTQL